jgi:hypothetical protein
LQIDVGTEPLAVVTVNPELAGEGKIAERFVENEPKSADSSTVVTVDTKAQSHDAAEAMYDASIEYNVSTEGNWL